MLELIALAVAQPVVTPVVSARESTLQFNCGSSQNQPDMSEGVPITLFYENRDERAFCTATMNLQDGLRFRRVIIRRDPRPSSCIGEDVSYCVTEFWIESNQGRWSPIIQQPLATGPTFTVRPGLPFPVILFSLFDILKENGRHDVQLAYSNFAGNYLLGEAGSEPAELQGLRPIQWEIRDDGRTVSIFGA
jgi:hypothetical protein